MEIELLARKLAAGSALSEILDDFVEKMDSATKVKMLLAANEKLNIKYDFKEGGFIQWKHGLRNRRIAGPFYILKILDEPIYETDVSRPASYGEPHNLLVLAIDKEGDALRLLLNSDRVEPYEAPTEDKPS